MDEKREQPAGEQNSKLKTDTHWYKDAVIYQVHVKSFRDGNGDGIGDFTGLMEKLDYLENLGVTAIWVLPFYPSPLKDDGYDISDYMQVNPDYGTLRDFRNFLRAAHSRGIKVITELVINHTSDQHEWFKRSRSEGPGGAYRDYYVWNDSPHKYEEARIIFKDFETSNWSWDPVAQAYYWHRFYSHQPDLNFDNPLVRKSIFRILDFWFAMGVDGFRLDAVPYLFEREGTSCENLPETYEFLRELRAHIDGKFSGRMLLAEANQWPEDAVAYFGKGDMCHMAFHFPLMPRMFIAIQMEDRFPIIDILEQTPPIPEESQWALFLRNHDELTLEMVTDEERDYMYRVYAKDARARINLGIRRRLAPLLSNDRKKIELQNILLFTMPGTPVVYYGDEIGMGDNYYLGDRNGVRTPMQWSSDKNAGFSNVNPQRLYLPIIIDPEYHYETINVENQERNTASLLWWMKRVIGIRKSFPAFGHGTLEFMHPTNPSILAFVRKDSDRDILVTVNLSRFSQSAEIDLSGYAGSVPEEIFSGNDFPTIRKTPYLLTFGAYDYYLFALKQERIEILGDSDSSLPQFRFPGGFRSFPEGDFRKRLESEILTPYVRKSRWYGEKTLSIQKLTVKRIVPVPVEGETVFLLVLELSFRQSSPSRYLLPVTYASGARSEELQEMYPSSVIARVKSRDQDGIMYDALFDERFSRALLSMVGGKKRVKTDTEEIIPHRSRYFQTFLDARGLDLPVHINKVEQSNSSVMFGTVFFLKIYRKLDEETNPEVEVLQFLTDTSGFPHIPKYAGSLSLRNESGSTAFGLLQGYVVGQGDAWAWVNTSLANFFDRILSEKPDVVDVLQFTASPLPGSSPESTPGVLQELLGSFFIEMIELLGRRSLELHKALAVSPSNPDFKPEPFTVLYQRSLYQSMRGLTKRALLLLARKIPDLPEHLRDQAHRVIARENDILLCEHRILSRRILAGKIRMHGDYHLGQVLFTGKDFIIIDFEGEPARAMSERKLKRSPIRDVAGMIRSFHYAANTALNSHAVLRPEDIPLLEQWVEPWYRAVSGIFLASYTSAGKDFSVLPGDTEQFSILLNAFLLEKAVYELMYELNNRPSWVGIPLNGIERTACVP